jgi:hypothetical protein
VRRCRPVISSSRGPGPNRAPMYMAVADQAGVRDAVQDKAGVELGQAPREPPSPQLLQRPGLTGP